MGIGEMISRLFQDIAQGSPSAFLGMGLVGIYFIIILGTAVCRIKKSDHMKGH